MKTNELIQWAGTICILSMYAIMSFRKDLFPLNLVLNLYHQQNLRKAGYIKQLEKLVDPVRVKTMLADPELFSQ